MRVIIALRIPAVLALVGLLMTPGRAEQELPVVTQAVSVQEAVQIALKNNPRIRAQAADVDAAQSRVGMSRSQTKIRISTTTFATTGTMSNIITGPPAVEPQNAMRVPDETQLDQNLMAMYPIYTGGRLKNRVRATESLVNAARSDVKSTKLDVTLEASVAYRRALLARRFVEAYEQRVAESMERLRIAEEQFKEGRIAKFDLLRNQTELAEAQQLLVNSERDVNVAMIDLKTVLGISQASELTLTSELSLEPVEVDIDELTLLAQRRRPEVAAAQARIKSAQATVGAAKALYKPQVYAVGMQDFAFSSGGDNFDQGFTIGVTAAIPLVDAGERKSAVNEAKAMVERLEAEQRQVILMVNRDVATALAELQAAGRNVELSETAVEQAEEDYRVIRLRYEAGRSLNVEVLDALASLTRARTNYAGALYEYSVARDRLERAVGGL